ncbi:MAG: dicarboxylate/amino acid:cation symporter, partial [Nitrospirales bacterium]
MRLAETDPTRLLYAILVGILSGVVLGGAFPAAGFAIGFLGELFLKALLALVVPLVMASMIVGVAGLGDVRRIGRLGGRTFLYFFATTALAVLLGLVLVLIIHPGRPREATPEAASATAPGAVAGQLGDQPASVTDMLKELLVGLVPGNLVDAMARGDILPLIVASLVFGAVLSTLGERGAPVLR